MDHSNSLGKIKQLERKKERSLNISKRKYDRLVLPKDLKGVRSDEDDSYTVGV